MGLIPNWIRRRAYFFDNLGHEVGNKFFGKTDELIKFDKRSFHTPQCFKIHITKKIRECFLWTEHEYFYNIDTPEPLILDKKVEPKVNSALYDTMLDTSMLRELLAMSKSGFKLEVKHVVIAVIVILGVIYFMSKKSGATA